MPDETVLLGSIQQETNTFNPIPTERADFQARREYFDDEILTNLRGTRTYIGGIVDRTDEEGLNLIPTVAAAAQTGGRATQDVFEFYTEEILEDIRTHRSDLDGVVLSLHGAFVPEGTDDGDGTVIKRVREEVGQEVPIVVTLDLHALTSNRMVGEADALVMVEHYPHDDMHVAGRNAVDILTGAMRDELDLQMAMEYVPMLPQVPRMVTYRGPMAEVMEQARELEERDGVLKANVNPTHQTADVPQTGFTASVVTDGDPALARETAREVAKFAWSKREAFVVDYPTPTEAVKWARKRITDGVDGPVLLADAGDVVGGGSPGDVTAVLCELLVQGVTNTGFASIWDPETVEQCIESGVGTEIELSELGGKALDASGESLEVTAYVKGITDGKFTNTGPMGTGSENNLGRTVVLQCGEDRSISVFVTENRQQPLDAEIWRHAGIQPERLSVIAIKSVNHFRADYEQFIDPENITTVNSPGLTPIDIKRLGHERLRRPIYPLDSFDDSPL